MGKLESWQGEGAQLWTKEVKGGIKMAPSLQDWASGVRGVEQGGHVAQSCEGREGNLVFQVEPFRQQGALREGLCHIPWASPWATTQWCRINSAISPEGQGPSLPLFSRTASINSLPCAGWPDSGDKTQIPTYIQIS